MMLNNESHFNDLLLPKRASPRNRVRISFLTINALMMTNTKHIIESLSTLSAVSSWYSFIVLVT